MGAYLAETIESVLENLRPGDEYYIVDGGSTDNSVEIIRRYEHRLTGWISEPDQGYADALAKGFARSSADFQCWINCGDLLLPGALDLAREKLSSTGADLIFGDDLYVDEEGNVIQVTNGHAGDLASIMLYGGWTPLQDACYWRRSFYEKVGGIDPSLRYAADYDLFLRMSLGGNSQYIPFIFSAFRRHGGQTSRAHAKSYQRERVACRRRELNRQSNKKWSRYLLNAYYWWKVRWRVRVQGRVDEMQQLVGSPVSNISCQASVSEGPR